MTNSNPTHARFRLLLGSVSLFAVLVALNAFVRSPASSRAMAGKPADGLPGQPEAMPGAMNDYVQQLDFGAGADPSGIFEGDLTCGMPAKCGGKTTVRLRIVPSNFANVADWDGALNRGNGHVVAKVSNLDDVPYDRLNLGPHDIAYLWVGDSQGLGRTVALYTVKSGAVKRLFKFKGRTFCRMSTPQPPAVHINTPPKCTSMDSKPLGAATEQASIEPFTEIASYVVKAVTRMFAQSGFDSGLWVSCSLGCCEAQF
jgi:hypothetical protein